METPNVLPTSEAARRLGVSPARVRQMLKAGDLAPVYFQDGSRLVSAASVRRLEAEREGKQVVKQ